MNQNENTGNKRSPIIQSIGQQFAEALQNELIHVDMDGGLLCAPDKPWLHLPILRWTAAESPIWCLAISPDETQAISGSGWHGATGIVDCTVSLWNLDTTAPIKRFHGHRGHVNAVAFSPNMPLVSSASDDRTIRHWDLLSGSECGRFVGHFSPVKCLTYASHGQWLASGGIDKIIRFSTPDGQPLSSYAGHTDTVLCLAISPDCRLLASGSADKTLRLWNLTTGTEVFRQSYKQPVSSLTFSADGHSLLWGTSDESGLLDVATKTNTKQFGFGARALAFLPALGAILFSAELQVEIWRPTDDHPQEIYRTGIVQSIAVFSKSNRFITAGYDTTLSIWELRSQ